MIFKKKNKMKRRGRKRKVFMTIALVISLMFGKPRLSSSRSSSSNFGNQTVGIERAVETPRGGFRNDPTKNEERVTFVSRINEDPGLARAARRACRNQDVQNGINQLLDQLAKGNPNPGIGKKPLGNGVIEHRHENAGRVIVRKRGSVIEILGKSGKKKANQRFVINRVKRNLRQGLYD